MIIGRSNLRPGMIRQSDVTRHNFWLFVGGSGNMTFWLTHNGALCKEYNLSFFIKEEFMMNL